MADERLTAAPDEPRRWEEAFTVLGLDRFTALWRELGLPPAVVERPDGVVEAAKAFLRDESDGEEPSTRVERAFASIASECGDDVAAALREWAVGYVVDETRADALLAWEHLLRRLCGLLTDDGPTVPSPLGEDSSNRLCSCVAACFDRESLRALRARIEEAARLPPSAWEQTLDDRVRRAAGDPGGGVLGALELAEVTVTAIARRHRAREALHCLAAELSAEERDRVLAWARAQGAAIGFPEAVVDRLADSAGS